jgi:hypothetical protein
MKMKVWEYGKGWTVINSTSVTVDKPAVEKPGVFEKNGEIYLVKPNADKTRLYAMKLVEKKDERLTEEGKHVPFDFEYARGAIYELSENDRMPIEKAKALYLRYGRCIVCGRELVRAEWVEKGIGYRCARYFKGGVGGREE